MLASLIERVRAAFWHVTNEPPDGFVHGPDGLRHLVRRAHANGEVTPLCGKGRWRPVESRARATCSVCLRRRELEGE